MLFWTGLYMSPSAYEKEILLHLNKAHNFYEPSFIIFHETGKYYIDSDFNMQPGNKNLNDFGNLNQFEHLILKCTC